MAKYTIRISTTESGWVDVETFNEINSALLKMFECIRSDQEEGYNDGEVWQYCIDDNTDNRIAFYQCSNCDIPSTYEYNDNGTMYDVPFGDATLDNAKPQFSHGGKRTGAGRKPNALPKKNINLRVTEEEAALVKAYLAELRKTQ